MNCPICEQPFDKPPRAGYGANLCWQGAANALRKGKVIGRYVEGWGVRRHPVHGLEAFQHGWVELDDGAAHDATPHSHCVMRFAAFRHPCPKGPRVEDVPLHRVLACPYVDGDLNSNYDADFAISYGKAKAAADTYCREISRREA